MPTLDTIPYGLEVFIDTIIFDLAFRDASPSCKRLVYRIGRGEVKAYVDTLVLTDLLHKLMLAEAFKKGFITSRSAEKLKRKLQTNRSLAQNLTLYQQHYESLNQMGIIERKVSKAILIRTADERRTHALLTGDSIHVGMMKRRKPILMNLATHDTDFNHIPDITVWSPDDVIP